MHLISVAQDLSLSVQQIPKLNSRSQLTQTNLKIQSNVLATVVERNNWATDLVKAGLQILLLPHPKDVVDVAVVQIEYWFTGAVVRITSLSQSTSDTKVATAVDVRDFEGGFAFDRLGKASVVFLSKDVIDELLVSPDVD